MYELVSIKIWATRFCLFIGATERSSLKSVNQFVCTSILVDDSETHSVFGNQFIGVRYPTIVLKKKKYRVYELIIYIILLFTNTIIYWFNVSLVDSKLYSIV